MRNNAVWFLPVMCFVGSLTAVGEDEPLRTISVSGTVETKTAPDQILWQISLTDTDANMRKAKEKSDKKVESVTALRQKLRVRDGDMETGNVSIRREYERAQHGGRGAFKHFVVTRSISIRQRDLSRFDEFLDALVSSADMEVNFNFESSQIHEIRAETRLKALRAAKEKAKAMAEAVDAKLGKVITIKEDAPSGLGMMSNSVAVQSLPAVDLTTDKFIPGAMRVQVTVHATFELK